MHSYEKWKLRFYLVNALQSRPPKITRAADLFVWLQRYTGVLGLPRLHLPDEDTTLHGRWTSETRRIWRDWRAQALGSVKEGEPEPSPLEQRIRFIAAACRLDAPQSALLGLFARISCLAPVRTLAAALNDQLDLCLLSGNFDRNEIAPMLAGKFAPRDLTPGGLLFRLGLLLPVDHSNIRASDIVINLIARRNLQGRAVRDLLLGAPKPARLAWEDFAHLGDLRDLALKVIGGLPTNSDRRQGDVNVLFYGPPGTGKSEFAKTLGAQLGVPTRFVGEHDGDDAEPNRKERIAALMLANALGAISQQMIVVADEADDLFAGVDEDDASTRQGSKVFMNRLVENTMAPTIWITNDINRLGPAVVRRMNLVVRFPKPGLAVRRKMIERISSRLKFRLDEGDVETLSCLPAPPALLENALRSAAKIGGASSEAIMILRSGMCALGWNKIEEAALPVPFNSALSSANMDLGELARLVTRARSQSLSFLLSGPPGTGKSAYARHLAQQMDMEALDKRYSDLSSKYLGESEKAISRAFEEAADTRAFLIIDEADSLLRARREARHSWEITQVNEMLTQMERHPLPFACTTNAPDLLDSATARRFLFKVGFQFMTEDQIALAFRLYFRQEAPASALLLKAITPADFANVKRRSEILLNGDLEVLVNWLEDEVRAKPEGNPKKFGFKT
jgi:transitional endoplasmic reticulum ATPase